MGPEFSGGASASLHLIDNESHALLLGDLAELLEEVGGSVVVTTLALNRLDNNTGDGDGVRIDDTTELDN